jgi:hypothetical protein
MNRTILQRSVLAFVCALTLVLIPVSYSWAQSSTPQQQDQVDRNGVNQNDQTNQDVNRDSNLNQDKQTNPSNTSDTNREKPSPTTSEQNRMQNQNQNQNVDKNQYDQNRTTTESSTERSQSTTTSKSTTDQAGENKEGLPATAGELPLLALIGALSLAAAAGTRFARAKSTR